MDLSNFTNEQLQKARGYAALVHTEIAENVHTADYYADHVTYEQKEKIREDELELASMILQGDLDGNFTVGQRMYFYLTGESIPFLP